jgi:hypothetical protein
MVMAMSRKTTFRVVLLGAALIAAFFTFAFVSLFGPLDPYPRMYTASESPDGTLSVELYRKKATWLCPSDCVDVLVRVRDNQRKVLYEDRIYQVDMWDDVNDGRYSEVLFHDDEILVGPNYYGGKQFGDGSYYVVRRANLAKN